MENKHDILQSYRQRQDEFRLPLREDGWQRLEAELFAAPKRRYSLRWPMAAAIALLCIAISVITLNRKEEIPATVEPKVSETIPPAKEKTDSTPADAVVPSLLSRDKAADSTDTDIEETILYPNGTQTEKQEIKAEGEPQPEENEPENEKPAGGSSITGPENKSTPIQYNNYFSPNVKKEQKRRWAFGITGGNGFTNGVGGQANSFETSPGPQWPKPEEPEEPETKASAGGGSGSSNRTSYYRHKMPVTVNASIRRYLTHNMAIESGISYTLLYSDLVIPGREGKEGHQALHYIGVPLKINWIFFEKQPFSFYLSGGTALEYCLSIHKDGYMDPPEINRWQASLQAAAGIQLSVYKQFSVYAEPGVAYYFDSNKGHYLFETIRTKNPLTFNLQMGIRFSY